MRIREFEEELEAAVIQASSLLDVEQDVLRELSVREEDPRPSTDLPALRAKRGRLQAAIGRAAANRLLADVDDDALTLDEVDAALAFLRRDIAELDAAIADSGT